VLFVCAENAFRSQIAEAFFNRFAKDAKAESAGTTPAQRINPLAIQVMKEVGIDISEKSPKRLDFQAVGSFDIVISFGCIVRSTFPTKDKLVEWLIEDPGDQTIGKFRRVRDVIQRKAKELIEELERKEGEGD
jgi:arsenate reductase